MDALPFLTRYDPPGEGEGTLDPLGLYQIADQLASQLVPAVRERMQRIRFLTAMAVGAFVTEGVEANPGHPDAAPFLVWEWLVVEALSRTPSNGARMWGVPGTLVAASALSQQGYLDAPSYLKTPRIFGFHGVYKRLAVHLGIVDAHLAPGPNAEGLVDAWAKDMGLQDLTGAKALLEGWIEAVARSLHRDPPRTAPNWHKTEWAKLALCLAPSTATRREKRFVRDLLLSAGERSLGALPTLWDLQAESGESDLDEKSLHKRLKNRERGYRPLVDAVQAYEHFARMLQDGFDRLRQIADARDAHGLTSREMATDGVFAKCVTGLDERFSDAYAAFSGIDIPGTLLQTEFARRFERFGGPMSESDIARALCDHHETIQQGKSSAGKRPWFDRVGPDRIYLRRAYRIHEFVPQPGRYVHPYRALPIRRFQDDLK